MQRFGCWRGVERVTGLTDLVVGGHIPAAQMTAALAVFVRPSTLADRPPDVDATLSAAAEYAAQTGNRAAMRGSTRPQNGATLDTRSTRFGRKRCVMSTVAVPPLDGGNALVTGASSGIGREVATQLASRAATLVLLARRTQLLEELRDALLAQHPHLQVVVMRVDLSDEADVDRVLSEVQQQVGPIDVLVNNAGVGDQTLFDRADWDRLRKLLHTNVLAVAHLTAALVPSMVARGRGGVLNIGSGAGLAITPAGAVYCGSKHFIDGFSEALRADLAGTGVVVTQVCPGPVDSEFDRVAGTDGGMAGGPPQFVRITAGQCAREALAGFERGAPLVFPGRPYRLLMTMLPFMPRSVQRRQAANAARRLRQAAPGDAAIR
jgi:uncharacterized protein